MSQRVFLTYDDEDHPFVEWEANILTAVGLDVSRERSTRSPASCACYGVFKKVNIRAVPGLLPTGTDLVPQVAALEAQLHGEL